MSSDRLRQLEKNLHLLREQLAGKEKAFILAPPEERVRIKQQIVDLKAEMKPFEIEYWQILASQSAIVPIPESEAEIVVAEIVEQVGQLQANQQYPAEMLDLLKKIYAEVTKPEVSAAAKLKGTLSLMPPFINVSWDAELDTEQIFRQHLSKFIVWCKGWAKKS